MTMSRTWTLALATGLLAISPALAQAQQHDHMHMGTGAQAGSGMGHEHSTAGDTKSGQATSAKAQVVKIEVTSDGFVAEPAKVKAGRPVTLVVTRKVERTCATEIVLKDYGINKALPLEQPVEVTFTPKKAGQVKYACAMDMVAGTLTVE